MVCLSCRHLLKVSEYTRAYVFSDDWGWPEGSKKKAQKTGIKNFNEKITGDAGEEWKNLQKKGRWSFS
ncbi:hypothetical protein UZ36_00505 [Candidatus Nitromaritima sp. SCGC AAA799-C22]|nr:hypothetical protein UZ36_00505 [Candidatus Nitromaritima sp. SCGC AAA799-C22]